MKQSYKYLIVFCCIIIATNVNAQVGIGTSSDSEEYHDENFFTTNNITIQHIKAFEQRSIQKIRDFAGFIEIISNKSYNDSLRKQSLNSAIKLFLDENCSISGLIINSDSDPLSVTQFFNKVFNLDCSKITSTATKIKNCKELKRGSNNTYTGQYSFILSYSISNKKSKKQKTIKTRKSVGIVLKQIEKNFGNEKKMVWEVLLGNIE